MSLRRTLLTSTSLVMLSLSTPSAALALSSGNVYVPLGSADSIIVVDPWSNGTAGRIDNVPNVHGLAQTPDGRHLIAGRNDESPLDESAPAKPAGVSEDDHAEHHARKPGETSSAVGVKSTVTVIRLRDHAIMRRVDVPGAVHHVTVSPTGAYALLTHPTQDTVSLLDLATYKVVATIPTGPLPNYAAFSPHGDLAYISNAGNNTVSILDVNKQIVRHNIVVGESPEHLVLSKDGSRLFVNNISDGTVSAIDLPVGKVSAVYPIGDTLHGIDLSEDEKTLFVASLGDEKIAAVDLASGKVRSAKLGPMPYHLATIEGTGKVFVSSADEPKIWVIDPETLRVVSEIPIGGKGHQMVQVIKH